MYEKVIEKELTRKIRKIVLLQGKTKQYILKNIQNFIYRGFNMCNNEYLHFISTIDAHGEFGC